MASLEIVALDTATPQLEVPQSGDTYSAPRALAISPQSLTGSAATTSLDIAQTWNTTGTPTAVKLNVIDTASNAASNLMDLQVGGTSRFYVRKNGLLSNAPSGAEATFYLGSVGFTDNASPAGVLGGTLGMSISGAANKGLTLSRDRNLVLSWNADGRSAVASDCVLASDAANTLAQRNATNAQTFNVYNTYTNSTNYERFRMSWVSNVLEIGTEAAGTGSTRGIGIAVRDIANGALVLRNANTGRNGTLTILANAGADQYFQAQNGTGTAIIWNGNEIGFGNSTGIQFRHRQDTGRACWGLNVNFPLSNTSYQFRSAATGDTVLSVQAITSQTGDLQQWVDSAGTALTSVLVDGAIQMKEQTAPAAPAANAVRIYAEDNGSGKTRLMARFATGAAQQIAIEP